MSSWMRRNKAGKGSYNVSLLLKHSKMLSGYFWHTLLLILPVSTRFLLILYDYKTLSMIGAMPNSPTIHLWSDAMPSTQLTLNHFHVGCKFQMRICYFYLDQRRLAENRDKCSVCVHKGDVDYIKWCLSALFSPQNTFILQCLQDDYNILLRQRHSPPFKSVTIKAAGSIKADDREWERWSVVSGGCAGCKCERDKSSPLG